MTTIPPCPQRHVVSDAAEMRFGQPLFAVLVNRRIAVADTVRINELNGVAVGIVKISVTAGKIAVAGVVLMSVVEGKEEVVSEALYDRV